MGALARLPLRAYALRLLLLMRACVPASHAEFEALVHLSDVAIVNAGAHFNTPRVTLSVRVSGAR